MLTKLIITAGCLIIVSPVFSQNKKDSLGLPGDNFDLYAAMELFKKSETPEAFEKALNANDNEINNLDLDADGKVDYIKVVDKTENHIHSIVMQVAVSKEEVQDVAVIEIEKTGTDQAHIQIVGDEELYGKNYIIEPSEETKKGKEALATDNADDDVYKSANEKGTSNNGSVNSNNNSGGNTTVINVWGWPSVQYVYGPSYMAYSSPWYWGYYPGWWQPWYPVYWGVYHRRVYRYHYPYYRRAYIYRSPVAHNYYYGRRSSANTVREYNRTGYYHQKQQGYKANVQPGKRYNGQPARDRGSRVREGQENNRPAKQNNPRRSEQPARNNQNQSPRQNNPRSGSEPRESKPKLQENRKQVSPQKQGGSNRGSGNSSSPSKGGSGGSQRQGGGGRSGGR